MANVATAGRLFPESSCGPRKRPFDEVSELPTELTAAGSGPEHWNSDKPLVYTDYRRTLQSPLDWFYVIVSVGLRGR